MYPREDVSALLCAIIHAQAILINPDTHIFEGAADPRCNGLALGW